jgi:transcriptional regulatory protein LevR
MRRILYENDTLDELVLHVDKGVGVTSVSKSDVILSVCTTGIGSSEFITQKLQHILKESDRKDVKVITVGITELQSGNDRFKSIIDKHNVLFSVGTVPPDLDVPFYSISELFSDQGDRIFGQLLKQKRAEETIYDECFKILSDYIVYLNPTQAIKHIKGYIENNDYLSMLSDDIKLKLVLHISGMIERLSHNVNEHPISVAAGDFSLVQIRQNIELIEIPYDIEITDIELSYIARIAFHS